MENFEKQIERLLEVLLRFYAEAGPERVGFVLEHQIIEIQNMSQAPESSFMISANDRHQYDSQIRATWHTHPNQSCNLSGEDYESFMDWPEVYHFIIGNDGVKCYVWDDKLNAMVEVHAALHS